MFKHIEITLMVLMLCTGFTTELNSQIDNNQTPQAINTDQSLLINSQIQGKSQEIVSKLNETKTQKTPQEDQKINITYKSFDVPNIDTSFKAYMSYTSINSTTSLQYKLQQKAITDKNGFRILDDKYMVAVGTYYAKTCGEEIIVTLEDGKEINCIVSDIKQDIHTDSKNQHRNGNVVEFIVDINKINSESRKRGDMSYSGLKGNIIDIKKRVE